MSTTNVAAELAALVMTVPGVGSVHPVRGVLAVVPGVTPHERAVRVRVHADHVDAEAAVGTVAGAGADATAAAVARLLRDRLESAYPGRRVEVAVRVVDVV